MADQEGLDDQPGEQADHHRDADETEFLCDDGEQEVGVRLGQVEQFFDAAAQPQAQPFAAAEGDQRVRQLVALAVRVGERIHEAEDALHPVWRGKDQQHKADHQHHDQPGKQLPVEPAQKQNAHGDRNNHHKGAEVRLAQQQGASQHHHRSHRQEALLEVVHEGGLARGVVGGVQHGEKLHQFGGLQVGEAERDPAAAAIDLAPDSGDQHHHQQQQAGEKQVGRGLLPHPHRHLEGGHAGAHAKGDEQALAQQIVFAVVAGVAGRFGNRERGGIHHHQAEREQAERQPQQAEVELGTGLRRARGVKHRQFALGLSFAPSPSQGEGWGEGCAALSVASLFTASTNTSARWM